jgi:hypothetical protein
MREEMLMTGKTICGLLKPLIGKSGSVFMLVSRVFYERDAPGQTIGSSNTAASSAMAFWMSA